MLDIFSRKMVYNPDKKRQEVFFDKDWNTLIDLYSYGHDIETSWLIDRGLKILNDPAVTEISPRLQIHQQSRFTKFAYKDHSVINECERGVNDTKSCMVGYRRKSVLGFHELLSEASRKTEYFEGLYRISGNIFKRTWLISALVLSGSGILMKISNRQIKMPIVEPWKCPYHNGRMCFEMINRL